MTQEHTTQGKPLSQADLKQIYEGLQNILNRMQAFPKDGEPDASETTDNSTNQKPSIQDMSQDPME